MQKIRKYFRIILLKLLSFLNLLVFFPIFIFFLPVALFKKVRFYQINYFLGGSVNLKLYLCRKNDQLYKRNLDIVFIKDFFKIFVLKKNISNIFWLEIISKNILPISPKNIFSLSLYNYIIEKFHNISILLNLNFLLIRLEDYHGYFRSEEEDVIRYKDAKNHLIKIPEEDLIKCNSQYINLSKLMNIRSNQPIVTFCNRDGAYKKFQLPHMDLSYHNFRNFPIQDYELCLKSLVNKDFFAIRMGNVTEKKMEFKSLNFFDYSKSKSISPAMDIYLIYKSKFFIGPESGLDKVANFFRKPIVLVNLQFRSIARNRLKNFKRKINLDLSREKMLKFTGEDIFFIPQKYFNIKTNKYFSFSEMLSKESGLHIFDEQFEKSNIKIINNTQKEIMDVANEMNDFLDNKLEFSNEDLELQKEFWTKFYNEFSYSENYKISPSFLRNNQNLLQ